MSVADQKCCQTFPGVNVWEMGKKNNLDVVLCEKNIDSKIENRKKQQQQKT
jgi:hypothetical protein